MWIVYNYSSKVFVWIFFSILFLKVIFTKIYSRTQKIKFVTFLKIQNVHISAVKIFEMLWKSLSLMAIQKFPLLRLTFCWPVMTIWVYILTYNYHICVLLFITFDLICNMSMFWDTWKLTHFSKIQNSNFEESSLGIFGEFWYVIPSALG